MTNRDDSRRSPDARKPNERLGPPSTPVRPPIVVHNEIEIRADPEGVWSVLIDVARWPSWYRACRWVRLEFNRSSTFGDGAASAGTFYWKAHPVELRSTIVAVDRPRAFTLIADAVGIHALRTFTVRPTRDGLRTVVVSHETQTGWLAWLGRAFLAPRLHAANQVMFDDLARAVGRDALTLATAASE